MNASENPTRALPQYGIRDDEKTRPCVVLFDWNGDDEAAVHVGPVGDFDDDLDVDAFRPRWHGVGRQPGTLALAVVLGASLAIGVCALLAPASTHAEAHELSLSVR